jgi:hypothetical protein
MGDFQESLEILGEIKSDPNAVTEEKLLACKAVVERILAENEYTPGLNWDEISMQLTANVPSWRKQWKARLEAIDTIQRKRSKSDLVALISIHNALMVMFDDIQGAMETVPS